MVGPACGCYAVQCFNMNVFLSTLMFHTCGIGDLPLLQGVPMEDVLRVLRMRFNQSGIEEKAARPAKPQ